MNDVELIKAVSKEWLCINTRLRELMSKRQTNNLFSTNDYGPNSNCFDRPLAVCKDVLGKVSKTRLIRTLISKY